MLQFIEISINFLRCAQCSSYRLRRLPPAGVPYVCARVQCVVCNSCWVGRSLQFRVLTWPVGTAFHKYSCTLEQYCFLPPRQILAGKRRYLLILFLHVSITALDPTIGLQYPPIRTRIRLPSFILQKKNLMPQKIHWTKLERH